jgi:hypothetical protein
VGSLWGMSHTGQMLLATRTIQVPGKAVDDPGRVCSCSTMQYDQKSASTAIGSRWASWRA